MTDISEVVSVNVTVQDAAVNAANFGTLAIFVGDAPGPAGSWVGEYNLTPSGLAAMVTDGFSTTDAAYLMVSRMVAQSPKTDRVKIYKRASANSQSFTLVPTNTTVGYTYVFEIGTGGAFTEISYTVEEGNAASDIATALDALIEEVPGVASEVSGSTITVTPDTGRVYIRNAPRTLTVKDTSSDAGIATDLAAAAVDDPDFFGFAIDSFSEAEINAAAAWAASNRKMFLGLSHDSDVLTSGTSDVASDIKTAGNHFASVVFTRYPSSYKNCGMLARQFSRDPGTTQLHGKDVAGAEVDSLTATEFANATGKNAIVHVAIQGVRFVFGGNAGSGRDLETTRAIEWLKARVAEAVFTRLANTEKPSYLDAGGIAQVEADIRAVLIAAENAGVLDPNSSRVNVPRKADVSTADKAAGILPDVTFSTVFTVGIKKVLIDGTVTI